MKKIYTLLTFVSLVLSTYALPQRAIVSTANLHEQRKEAVRQHIAERADRAYGAHVLRMPAETPQPATRDTMEATNLKYEDYNEYGELLEIFEVDPWIEFTASTEKYYATLSVKSTKLVGAWTEKNLDAQYSYASIINGKDTTECNILKADIAYDGDTLTGSITLDNNLTLVLKWYYVIPTPTRTANIDMPFGYIKTFHLSEGALNIEATDERDSIFAAIYIYTDSIEGTYGIADLDDYYTYVGILDEWGWDVEEYFDYEAGDVTITKKGEEYLVTTSFIMISENTGEVVLYNLTIHAEEDPGLEYDSQEALDVTFRNIIVLEDAADEDYGHFAALQAADATTADKVTAECQLIFFYKKADANIIIPEGEYTIDDSYMPGTVKSSTGYSMWGTDPSFAGKLEFEAGEAYYTDLWYMMEGKVTVKKTGDKAIRAEVNATNSYSMPIHIIIEGNIPEGIEQIETAAPATKTLIDGQLIIRRGENIYNAVGAKL